jgi:hypothetical protein
MAININNAFTTFDTFVKFAEHRSAAGLKGEVAKATVAFDNRNISSVTVGSASRTNAGWFSRTGNDKIDNDRTREIFKAAIVKMFGGESEIPPEVVKAMEMENYGHGRPLTARRILLVKAAIDKTDAPRVGAELKFQATGRKVFNRLQPETKAALVGKGYTKAELPNMARAVKAYAKSQNVSEAEALKEVTTAGTKANRLASYGGRFLASPSNFADGLRLLESFEGWYADLKAFKDSHALNNAAGDTPTKLHIDGAATSTQGLRGLEAMVFQHIAVDSSIDIKKDGEEVFGMANNAAMRFFGRNMHESVLGSVLNVPAAKRGVLFAAVDVFQPLFRDGAAVAANQGRPASEWRISKGALFVSRCLAHLDELSALQARGQLTAKNILRICFPDIPKGRADLRTLNAGCEAIFDTLNEEVGMMNQDGAWLKMLSTGCSLDEILRFYRDGTQPPVRGNMTDWTMPLSDYEGGGFAQMRSDLPRNYNYYRIVGGLPDKSPAGQILPADQADNNIAFPDGTRLACSSKPEHQGNVGQVEAKIKALCGDAHGFQAEVVAFCLSQSGKAPMRHALKAEGIFNAEHAVADISLSKDAITGAVTIHYTSPASLPVRFSWHTTVNTDGTTSTTPLQVEKPIRQLDHAQARTMILEAAGKYDCDLSNGKLARSAVLLAQNAIGLLPDHAKLLAQFLVKLPLDSPDPEISELCDQRTASFAADLRTARSFAYGDPRMQEAENFFKTSHNAYINKQFNQARNYGDNTKPGSANIFGAMIGDLPRAHYTINGQAFAKDDDTDFQAVFNVFKHALPSEKAQKAVSILMHQGVFGDIFTTQLKAPTSAENGIEPVELHDTAGGRMFLQRDMEVFEKTLVSGNLDMHFDLMVSPDGNTATINIACQDEIFTGDRNEATCGTLQLRQKITLDLRPDIPVVTDVKLSQSINP